MVKKRNSRDEQKLLRFLKKKGQILSPLLILTHDYPDPDALAGAYALKYLAEHSFGIKSRIVYKGIIGRIENRNMVSLLQLPVHKLRLREIEQHTHIALVDTQPEFENNPFPANRKATLIIDQHPPVNLPQAECALLDAGCGATSVILAKAILSLKIDVPKRLATALAYGIITDTLNLYRAKRQDIVKTYLGVLPFADIHLLARIQVPVHDKEYFETLSQAVNCTKMRQGLTISHLGRVSNPDTVSEVADFLLCYKSAKWSFVTGRFKNKLHASLRTKERNKPAADILRKCFKNPEDAGGHGQIAGGSLRMESTNDSSWIREEKYLQSNIVKLLKLKKGDKFYYPFKADSRMED